MATYYNDGTKDIANLNGWWTGSGFTGTHGLPSVFGDVGIIQSGITATLSGTYINQNYSLTVNSGGTVINNGSFSGDTLGIASDGTFINNGTMLIRAVSFPVSLFPSTGSFTNNGSISSNGNMTIGASCYNFGQWFIGGNVDFSGSTGFFLNKTNAKFEIGGSIKLNLGNGNNTINNETNSIFKFGPYISTSVGTIIPTVSSMNSEGGSSFGGAIIGSIF